MNNAEQIIQSGILERFVLGLTNSEESMKVKQFIRKYPEIRTQISAIRATMSGLADKYNIPPPKRNNQLNERKNKAASWFNKLFF